MADTTRDGILGKLRRARQGYAAKYGLDAAAAGDVDARLQTPPVGPQPRLRPTVAAASQGSDDRRLSVFIERLEAAAAHCVRVHDSEEAVRAITGYLAEHHVSERPVAADHPLLRTLPWSAGHGPAFAMAMGDTPAGLTLATLGIAETGSIVLQSSPDTPTSLNFLPDILICLLDATAVVNHLEDAWALLRGQGPLPRAINLVTGPSRTADVEQTLQLGAHGPRHLLVVLSDG